MGSRKHEVRIFKGMDKDVLANATNVVLQAKKSVQSLVASAKGDLENAMMMTQSEPDAKGEHQPLIVRSIAELDTKLVNMIDAIKPIG